MLWSRLLSRLEDIWDELLMAISETKANFAEYEWNLLLIETIWDENKKDNILDFYLDFRFLDAMVYLWENNGMTIRTILVPTQCPRDKLYSSVYSTPVQCTGLSVGCPPLGGPPWLCVSQWGINNNKIWVSANWSIVLIPSLSAITRRRPLVWTFC